MGKYALLFEFFLVALRIELKLNLYLFDSRLRAIRESVG